VVRYAGQGVYNTGGTVTATSSTITLNTNYGIYHGGGTTTVSQSVIRDNGSYGFFNSTSATTTAENNYWGTSTGPYHATLNPSGTGNEVSNYVDFSPWLGQVHYLSGSSSVFNSGIRWTASTTYLTAWTAAVATWNALGQIDISEATSTADLDVFDVDEPLEIYGGAYDSDYDILVFNTGRLINYTSSMRQKTATHELGHALGLDHSYWDNVMYFASSTHYQLGDQDIADYEYLYP
jgi:predicted Zn-dependent protease